MSSATFYKWHAKYGGMGASLMARMKELEEENRRLKTMYAEARIKAEIVQEAWQKSGAALSAQGDGVTGRCYPRNSYHVVMYCFWYS